MQVNFTAYTEFVELDQRGMNNNFFPTSFLIFPSENCRDNCMPLRQKALGIVQTIFFQLNTRVYIYNYQKAIGELRDTLAGSFGI